MDCSLRLTESRQCALDGDSADDLSLEDSSEAAILPDDTALSENPTLTHQFSIHTSESCPDALKRYFAD